MFRRKSGKLPIIHSPKFCLAERYSPATSDLRSKVAQAWTDLPAFLTISEQEVWRRGRSGDEADILHQIRLSHLQSAFLVEWAASLHGIQQGGALFASASKLLAWVNAALVRREQLGEKGAISLGWSVCCPNGHESSFDT
jgi:hypothetical protein